MYTIEKSGTTFEIANFPWDQNGYKPKTFVTIGYDDGGYSLNFVSYDTDMLAIQTEHNSSVCTDSCMELFMQFAPQTDDHYINVEINPNGAIYNGINTCREDSSKISPEIIDKYLDVKTEIFEDRWEIKYYIPKEYIEMLIPTYKHGEGIIIKGNFYKCAEDNTYPHFGCFNNITWDHPDFHRPEFFAEFKLV